MEDPGTKYCGILVNLFVLLITAEEAIYNHVRAIQIIICYGDNWLIDKLIHCIGNIYLFIILHCNNIYVYIVFVVACN